MASLVVIVILLDAVLLAVLVPVNSYWASDVAGGVSILVASLIVGYVFAVKIQEESRRGAIGSIAILSTVVLTFATLALFMNPYTGTAIGEALETMYSTSGWTTTDWFAYSGFAMVMTGAVDAVFALAFSFIGLYAGSMLRKPSKSQK